MDVDSALALCARWLPTWTGNQPEALAAFYSEDCLYRDPGRPNGLRGRDELLRYLGRLLTANPAWRWAADEVIPTRDGFTLKWRAEIPIGDETVVEHGLDIVEVDAAGLIARNEVFFDRTALFRALGAGDRVDESTSATR